MSDAHLLPRGSSLARYIVVRHLGTGGQGVVYAAYDPDLDRSVALKLLRPDVGAGSAEDRRTRLLREAQDYAKLKHPNVVRLHHVGTFLDQLYLALEFMAKGTLADWLCEPRAPEEVLARFIEAGRGLAAAHASGLVHRDFKPENVLLDDHGVAHVADFGLAQRGEAVSGAGTTRYLSPEQQGRTQAVGPASDQYSFCVALCEALTGQLPLPDKLPPNVNLPPWLRPVLLRGLATRPADRFPSMDALLAALVAGPEARRRLLSRAGLALLVAVSALAVGRLATRETSSERAQRECLARVQATEEALWSPQRVASMGANFAAVAGPVGSDTFARVKQLMDPEVKAWTHASVLACVQPVSAAHERCLESRGRVLRSFSELFLKAEPRTVASSLNAVYLEVLPVAGCLTSSVATPRVVPDSEADQRLRPNLGPVRVLSSAGQYAEAAVAAMSVVDEAHAAGAVRVEAEAQLLAGQLHAEMRRSDTEALLMQAIQLADQASADEERARAWVSLISWYSSHEDLERSYLARDQADSILERLGRPDHLEAQYQGQLGQLRKAQGDTAGAVAAFKLALDLCRKHHDDSHPLVLRALTNYALSLPATEAIPLLQKVLDARASTFGEQHPETATAAYNLGVVSEELGCAPMLPPLRRALEIWLKQQPPDVCRQARAHCAIARAHACSGGEALPLAFEEERAGIELILQKECEGTVNLEQELEWMRLLLPRLEHPALTPTRIDELLALVKTKEDLPAKLAAEK